MSNVLRIGNAQGFWGDRVDAATELVAGCPQLDYLTMDYLAEVTLSIMASQQERNPKLGYARDFVDVVRSLADPWKRGSQVRLVSNAGGLNPLGCAEACLKALQEVGCDSVRIAVVSGDDVLHLLQAAIEMDSKRFENLDTGSPVSCLGENLVTANAYLDAKPIVAALETGAEIIITGRVADPSLVVGPFVYHFGCAWDDYAKLAGATVAGHVLECGTQATGGISTNWLDISDPANIGFPIAELLADGSATITKPSGTGGVVNEETVKEQLLYEIGNPFQYITPDVVVSYENLLVEEFGNDRVKISGALGTAPPKSYKVSATFRDGYWATATLTLFGQQAVKKAQRCGEIIFERVRRAGFDLERTHLECLGTGAVLAGIMPSPELLETVLRVSVADRCQEAVERFSKEIAPLVTGGAPGVTDYLSGRPRVRLVYGYWPTWIDKNQVTWKIDVRGQEISS